MSLFTWMRVCSEELTGIINASCGKGVVGDCFLQARPLVVEDDAALMGRNDNNNNNKKTKKKDTTVGTSPDTAAADVEYTSEEEAPLLPFACFVEAMVRLSVHAMQREKKQVGKETEEQEDVGGVARSVRVVLARWLQQWQEDTA